MPNITLPDGSVRSFDNSITGFQLASDIGPGLAKAALIMLVDDIELDPVSYTHLTLPTKA